MSLGSREAVITTTGTARVRASDLSRASSARPLASASFRSSRTSFGSTAAVAASASSKPGTVRMASPSQPCSRKASRASSASWGLSSTSRIFGFMLLFPQSEIERRPLVRLRFRPHAAAMAVHHALHDREADAGAFELLLVVQALEHAEELVRVLHVEADAVVLHVDRLLAVLGA